MGIGYNFFIWISMEERDFSSLGSVSRRFEIFLQECRTVEWCFLPINWPIDVIDSLEYFLRMRCVICLAVIISLFLELRWIRCMGICSSLDTMLRASIVERYLFLSWEDMSGIEKYDSWDLPGYIWDILWLGYIWVCGIFGYGIYLVFRLFFKYFFIPPGGIFQADVPDKDSYGY